MKIVTTDVEQQKLNIELFLDDIKNLKCKVKQVLHFDRFIYAKYFAYGLMRILIIYDVDIPIGYMELDLQYIALEEKQIYVNNKFVPHRVSVKKCYTPHAYLDPKYRNNGIMTAFYRWAIYNYNLLSAPVHSLSANLLWRKLACNNEAHAIKNVRGTLHRLLTENQINHDDLIDNHRVLVYIPRNVLVYIPKSDGSLGYLNYNNTLKG